MMSPLNVGDSKDDN